METQSLGYHEGLSFKDQVARAKKYEVAGGTAKIVDIIPETPKTVIPVFFAPAWGCTTAVYEPALKVLSETNRRVISLNHPRIGVSMERLVPEWAGDNYPTEELRKALNILGVLEHKKIKQTDVIAHSEGALNVVIAATLHPEKFRNIVLFAPAGLIGADKFKRLLKGFAGQSKRAKLLLEITRDHKDLQDGYTNLPEIPITNIERHVAKISAIEAIKYLAKNPIRGINEAKEIAGSQIFALLPHLQRNGVGIVVMAGVDDPVFRMESMQALSNLHKLGQRLDGFLSVRGGHGEIGNHPELFMAAAESQLTALAEKRGQI